MQLSPALWWLAVSSVVIFVVSLLAVPLLVVAMPADYFTRQDLPAKSFRRRHPVVRWTLRIVRNVLGALLVLVGVVLLFTPGQGILAILLGLSLLEYPGKREMMLRVARRPGVKRTIDRWREKAGRAPIELPKGQASDSRGARTFAEPTATHEDASR